MLTAGSMLKDERLRQSLTLEDASASTKINASYLAALEKDEYQRFPSAVYARGFLQNYAKFLGIDVEKVIALYRRSVSDSTLKTEVKNSAEKPSKPRFVLTPGILIVIVVAVLVISTLGYLVNQYYNFQKPPELTVSTPENAAVVDTQTITIEGKTDTGMFLTINDEPIKLEQDGSFETTIGLSAGSNTIILKSRHPDNIGKEALLTLKVKYVPEDEENNEESVEGASSEETVIIPPAITTMQLVVSVLDESAWIEISVDDEPVFASIAPPQSQYTYSAERSLLVRSGRASSTQISVNNEPRTLFNDITGVASILCELKNSAVDCHQP